MKTNLRLFQDANETEFKNICEALNKLPGVTVTDGCYGENWGGLYYIFFTCTSFVSLGILARCVDRNYSSHNWEILTNNSDIHPCNNFILRSIRPLSHEEACHYTQELVDAIKYWSDSRFADYFVEQK